MWVFWIVKFRETSLKFLWYVSQNISEHKSYAAKFLFWNSYRTDSSGHTLCIFPCASILHNCTVSHQELKWVHVCVVLYHFITYRFLASTTVFKVKNCSNRKMSLAPSFITLTFYTHQFLLQQPRICSASL